MTFISRAVISWFSLMIFTDDVSLAKAEVFSPRLSTPLAIDQKSLNDPFDIWVVEPISKKLILPSSELGKPDKKPGIRVVATPGEIEPASIVVRVRNNVEELTITATDLIGDQSVIPADSVDTHFVKVWFQADGAGKSPRIGKRTRRNLVPELLLKDPVLIHVDYTNKKNYARVAAGQGYKYIDISKNARYEGNTVHRLEEFLIRDEKDLKPLTLSAGINQQIWLTLEVPDNVREGEYVGGLSISSESGLTQRIPIILRVLPFELKKSSLLYSIYYRGQLNLKFPTISSEFKTREQLRAELRDIKNHGIEYPVMYQGNSNPASRGLIQYLRSPELMNEYLLIRNQLGFPKDHLFYLGRGTITSQGTAGLNHLKRSVRRTIDLAREFGYGNVYFYGKDEASGEVLMAQRENWVAVREEGGKIFAANNRHDILQTHMYDVLDVAVLARKLDPEEAKMLRKKGINKILSYNNPQSAVEDPYSFRKHYGIDLWAAGYDGAMIYAYQHGLGSVWNDFDHVRFRDHCLTYPTVDGVIGTMAWEGVREAIDDVRYLSTLEQELSEFSFKEDVRFIALKRQSDSLFEYLKGGGTMKPSEVRDRVISILNNLVILRDTVVQ